MVNHSLLEPVGLAWLSSEEGQARLPSQLSLPASSQASFPSLSPPWLAQRRPYQSPAACGFQRRPSEGAAGALPLVQGAWFGRAAVSCSSLSFVSAAPMPMDLKHVPSTRERGWYLALMAPNIKGPTYAWLDPSRLYCHQQGFQDCVEDLIQPFRGDPIDQVAGIDAMGFILGSAIANTLQKSFVAIRKAGHLCVETLTQPYRDYSGRDKVMEMRTDAITPGLRVLLVDQWVETGGTMQAAAQLVERQGGVVAGIAAICIEDSEGGRWLKDRYKWSHCVPPHLMAQFNAHRLDSFKAFEPGQGLP
ncbi:adenine phosphoribosyltransferase isoform X3 [Pogona vitticeps]